MKTPLLILGCGGHGRVVADAALDCGYEEIAFLDDRYDALPGPGPGPVPFPVLGAMKMMSALVDRWPTAIVAIGDGRRRLALFHDLKRAGYATPSIIHPSAVISRGARLGEGVFIAPGAIINTGAKIADAVIVNTGARIDHDCDIGQGTHIAPGVTLSGTVIVGATSWIGTGSSVRQDIRIGDDVMIGVGAAVVKHIPNPGTYVGVPARRQDKRKDGRA